MAEITVLLPIFNGAGYLEDTLTSLSCQSFSDFEVLCIDDCSSDESAEIVRRHAEQDSRFIYIHTGTNLGSAAKAVNFAAARATGRWFVYSSQDDLFSADWLEKLHVRALETGADAVLPDVEFYHADGSGQRKIIGVRGDRSAILTGRDAFVASLDWSIPGNALWPIAFLLDHGFKDFGAFADEFTVRLFFLSCAKVAFCDGVFYYRQDNQAAITKKPSAGLLDIPDTSWRLWNLITDSGFDADVHSPFALRTLRATIRARALLLNNPSLSHEAQRVEGTWQSLRASAVFQQSLAAYAGSAFRKGIYLPAARHRGWFETLARVSAFWARRKRAK
ncbi:glycosyltransferase family A protein (plasmid) [Tritonibacter scottomollicae]|uniref:Glycosyltransferase family A protein n=1 Tax=Tritonibacter scottomollicae TaxID=483013 RepID=A0ABZ0HM49_TRISK|nr:glycosyltransferase family A protein [Tritonibacter scottomollicae]WOI35346.1 glycosyltransferase family A protein [Tritonibacter scottomollicae]